MKPAAVDHSEAERLTRLVTHEEAADVERKRTRVLEREMPLHREVGRC